MEKYKAADHAQKRYDKRINAARMKTPRIAGILLCATTSLEISF